VPLATTGIFAERYRGVRRLGAGGMATVFLAEDERLGRLVAVKRLHGESTEEVARRFRREARLGAALNHPNVVAVYDITSDDEGVLIVMEYVEGRTLREEIEDGPIAPERAIGILRGVAGALDYAHQNGVVHRDVKPANVLIRHDGEVKLADLGIATAAEQSKITRSGAVLGTAAYMAPERLDGRAGGSGVDVYALAAVAFEMLAGRKAYEGSTPLEVAHKVVNDPPPDLSELLPDTPAPLAEALRRALSRDPEDRPATAGELVAAIETALPEAAANAAVLPGVAPSAPPAQAPVAPPESAAAPPPENGGDEETGTPARVLPPERRRTRPAREAAAARSDRQVGALDAGIRHKKSPPPEREPRPGDGERSRPVLIAAVLGAIALVAIVAIVIAGGGEDEPAKGEGDRAERIAPGANDSKDQESDPAPQAPASPEEPGGGSPAAGTPDGAVNDFYQRAARGDYAGAWALATPSGREQLGGFESFSRSQSTLESISFLKLKAKEKGDGATVDLRSEAVHSDRVDRCKGSVGLVRSGGSWKLDSFNIAACQKSPRP